jgi:hypothetical protein
MATFRSNKISSPITKINDIADQPTIGAVSEGVQFDQLNVAFTPAARGGTSFKAVSNPGGIVGQGSSSPIPVRGLVPGTNYTFTVNGTSGGVASSASASNTPTGAIVPIATVTVTGSTDTSLGFVNIPQIYQDLYVVLSSRRTDAITEGTQFMYSYAGSIASTTKFLNADSTVFSSRVTGQNAAFLGAYPGASSGANIFGTQIIHILNYRTTSFKTVLCRTASDRNGNGQVEISASLLRDTNPLTTFGFSTYNASVYYTPGTTATLYGVKGFN